MQHLIRASHCNHVVPCLAVRATTEQSISIGNGYIISLGNIEVIGPAQIVLGAWPNSDYCLDQRSQLIEKLFITFNNAGIPTRVSSNIQQELWRNLIINNGVNPLSALTVLDTRELTSHPMLTKRVYEIMEEVASVAKADDIYLSSDDVDEMYELICNKNVTQLAELCILNGNGYITGYESVHTGMPTMHACFDGSTSALNINDKSGIGKPTLYLLI
ncbi:ketopantoate reductase family protein [Psychromonas sp. KJ10-10]|uniref:ketopantoate reductase family protein n=1 Tax=Psychromonas sp. KJ10-10 TaxID=3391823 RepID=UPI0039B406B2